jgi:AcrR family transcriptional regulator
MNKNNKLESLFDVSIQIFAKFGYKKTTVEDIASKLGTTKGNIYFYVKNKEDLYHKTISHGLLKWKDFVKTGIEHETNHEKKFILLAELAVEYLNNNEDLKSIIRNDPEIYTVKSAEDRFYDVNMEALSLLKNVLSDGVFAGVFTISNIDYVSHLIYSIYIMYLIQSYGGPQTISPDILFNEALTLILRGILVR